MNWQGWKIPWSFVWYFRQDKQPSNYIEGTKQILRDIEAFEDEKRTSKRTRKFKESWRACILLNKKAFVDNSNEFKQLELKHKGIKKDCKMTK
jgi:hypothetical protein